MLKNIPAIISPELLKILCEMGHGDEIVFGDGNFPASSCASNYLVRCDGHDVTELLDAILKLFPLDVNNNYYTAVMATDDGSVPSILTDYGNVLTKHGYDVNFEQVERHAFYDRAKKAYCVIATSEMALYANLIIKKGCVVNE